MKNEYKIPWLKIDVIEEEDVITESGVILDEDEMPVLPFPFATNDSAEENESFLY